MYRWRKCRYCAKLVWLPTDRLDCSDRVQALGENQICTLKWLSESKLMGSTKMTLSESMGPTRRNDEQARRCHRQQF